MVARGRAETEWVDLEDRLPPEVADRCDGTLTKVTRGRVAVRDFRRRKDVSVTAGKSYLARPRR